MTKWCVLLLPLLLLLLSGTVSYMDAISTGLQQYIQYTNYLAIAVVCSSEREFVAEFAALLLASEHGWSAQNTSANACDRRQVWLRRTSK